MSDLIASQKVMRHYLNALLTEEPEVVTQVEDVKKAQLNKLLAEVKPAKPAVVATSPAPSKTTTELTTLKAAEPKIEKPLTAPTATPAVSKVEPAVRATVAITTPPPIAPAATVVKDYRAGKFQALFFEVAGLKVALPLKDLGGIHQIGALNTLPGKPAWYKGVMLYREQKINVVNTAMWVMPEKYDQALAEKLNYQYVIMLGKSSWGLACETLVNTITLEQDDVKWRSAEGKRPWLAGLIKQHMCALLDVDALVALLAAGASSD